MSESSGATNGDEYLERWSVAMGDQQYDTALAVLDDALRAAAIENNADNLTAYTNLKEYTRKIQAAFSEGTTRVRAQPTCSMCGKSEADDCILVAGADVVICDGCIKSCVEIVDGQKRARGIEFECSFCGKKQSEVARIVAGPGVAICDNCCQVCAEIIDKDKGHETED